MVDEFKRGVMVAQTPEAEIRKVRPITQESENQMAFAASSRKPK